MHHNFTSFYKAVSLFFYINRLIVKPLLSANSILSGSRQSIYDKEKYNNRFLLQAFKQYLSSEVMGRAIPILCLVPSLESGCVAGSQSQVLVGHLVLPYCT